jgi:hypothetical protein
MTQQEKQMEDQLRTNYRKALKLVPPEFRDEFRETIMPLKEFQSFASPLSYAKKTKSKVIPSFLENLIQLRFSINGFGRRMIIAKANPITIYTELVRNLWS